MRLMSKRMLQEALKQYHGQEPSVGQYCYQCNLSKLSPELSSSFVQLHLDEETQAFLQRSARRANNICLQLLYAFVRVVLGLFLSLTSINGLLERGKMFVFSEQQLRRLVPSDSPPPTLILDIGSGDGHVTDKLRCLGATVYVTETSRVMQRVLRKKGYHVLDADSWHCSPHSYDLISCLNVLDRCDRPLSMLRLIYSKLRPGGMLLLAIVMPYSPFVEKGASKVAPSEVLGVRGEGWEEGVCSLWSQVLSPLGLTLVALARVPYLCEGNLDKEVYRLDDAILLLRRDQ